MTDKTNCKICGPVAIFDGDSRSGWTCRCCNTWYAPRQSSGAPKKSMRDSIIERLGTDDRLDEIISRGRCIVGDAIRGAN